MKKRQAHIQSCNDFFTLNGVPLESKSIICPENIFAYVGDSPYAEQGNWFTIRIHLKKIFMRL